MIIFDKDKSNETCQKKILVLHALHSSSNRRLKPLVLKLVGQVSLDEAFKHLIFIFIFFTFTVQIYFKILVIRPQEKSTIFLI